MITQEQAIKEWQDLLLTKCEVKFHCGGDDMGDVEFSFYSNGNLVTEVSQELQDYIENKMYNNVTFYQNSDGHYQGESGIVLVGLETDDDEPYFVYSKSSQAEYNETWRCVTDVKLNDKQIQFIKKNVTQIFGGLDDSTQVVWKNDVILTESDEDILDEITTEVEIVGESEIPDCEGDVNEWFAFNTSNDEGDEMIIEGNILKLNVRRSITTYEDSSW